MKGFVESIRPFQVRGWAVDDGAPEFRVAVVAKIDQFVIASGYADLYRADLVHEGQGSGKHAFVLNLKNALTADEGNRLIVEASAKTGNNIELRTLPSALNGLTPEDRSAKSNETSDRDSRQIAYFPFKDSSQHPIFVLGSARSGTSAIGQAISQHTRYKGDEEGHLFAIVNPLMRTVASFYESQGEEWAIGRATSIARVPKNYFVSEIRRLLADVSSKLHPHEYWLDKTPGAEMIEAAEIFLEIWPNARFIFAKRRGIENVLSRLRKFPTISFSTHCIDWANNMVAWLKVRSNLKGCYIEIDQMNLALSPIAESTRLAKFLGLDDSESDRVGLALRYDLPERTSNTISKSISIEETNWTSEEKKVFKDICGVAMTAYGYSLDADYYSRG